jgi:glyoxylate carboligase
MPRFSARTIAIVQQNVSEMLTDTCTIQRQTGATGTMGEPLNQLELIASGVACRVIRVKTPNANSQAVIGSQKSMVERYRLICPVDTAFRVDDVVTIGSDVYQVVDVEDKLTDAAFAGAVITRVRT